MRILGTSDVFVRQRGTPTRIALPDGIADLLSVALLMVSLSACAMLVAHQAGRIPTIWPANGFLLAMLLTAAPGRGPAYVLTGILGNAGAILLAGFAIETALRLTLVNACEVTLALALVRRFIGQDCDLSQPRNLWRFALAAAIAAPGCATLINLGVASLSAGAKSQPFFIAFFLAHSLGIIMIAPLSLAVRRRDFGGLLDGRSAKATLLTFGVLLGIATFVFYQSRYPLLFLVLPPLVITTLLYGLPGGALGLFLVTLVAVGFTVAGRGPTTIVVGSTGLERILILQVFLAVAATLMLVLSALLAERDRARQQLQDATDELRNQAATDGLTGLANRRHMDEVLELEWRRSARVKAPISFLLVDVDRFKAFNDHYGHQAGDRCLRAIAEVVKATCQRSGDVVCRYGGEELAIVLPATGAVEALTMADKVRRRVEGLRLPHVKSPVCGGIVTISVGAATAEPAHRPDAAEGLIKEADEWLYEAKRTGRNRALSRLAAPSDPMPESAPAEDDRVAVAQAYQACLGKDERRNLDEIAGLAAKLLGTPIGLVNIVGRDHQASLGQHGLDASMPRKDSFCAHTMAGEGPMVVPDATADPRFSANPIVTGGPRVRFYAGAPLIGAEGAPVGALCVIDQVARPPLNALERAELVKLAAMAMETMNVARRNHEIGKAEAIV